MALSESGHALNNQSHADPPRQVVGASSSCASIRKVCNVNEGIKRAFDIPFSLAVLFFLIPLFLSLGIAIKLGSAGPVFFKQPRYGRGGELFYIYKFRTMRQGAGQPNGKVLQTSRIDSRVTSLGAFLRRTSLDELPQFINVLKGEMSVVGPRPHAPKTMIGSTPIESVLKDYSERHEVRPGITGLAQVSGFRGPITSLASARIRFSYDVTYTRNWSFWSDIIIILRTIKSEFLGGSGY